MVAFDENAKETILWVGSLHHFVLRMEFYYLGWLEFLSDSFREWWSCFEFNSKGSHYSGEKLFRSAQTGPAGNSHCHLVNVV